MCNFGRGPYGDHSCEIILFGEVVQEKMLFKDFSYF